MSVVRHIAPLDWVKGREGERSAQTPFGSYYVRSEEYRGIVWGYCFDEYYDEDSFSCESYEDGMSQAWADWVKRISPALK